MRELSEGASVEDAIDRRRETLRELVARFDAVHLLGQVMLGELNMDAETYKESDDQGSAYVVEMVAAEFLSRPTRAGSSEITPAIDANVLGPIRECCQEAALLESFRRHWRIDGTASPEGAARSRAATHHLMIRGPGWPWQEHETLRGLFGEQRFARRLKPLLGFDADDAIRCTEAAARLVTQRLAQHMQSARDNAGAFSEQHPAYRWADATLSGWKEAGPPEIRAHAMTAIWALNHIGDALLLDAAAIAHAAGIEETAASCFLSALGQPIGQPETLDWFGRAEAVRARPYIDFGDQGYLLTVPGNDLWSLRGVFETALKSQASYPIHRARWLELRASELLAGVLRPDEDHRSVLYAFENAAGEPVEGEIDGLLCCGDTALVVEAKSATMRPGARRGGEALIKHLRENLTKAAEQGTRARTALAKPGTLTLNGAPLQLAEDVREVHPIVVTLDDLSSVSPVLWQLEGSRVLPAGVTVPWVVTLHELDLICQTVEWPAQLIHFLRRRSRLNQLARLTASDELDWWMHYLLLGLYFEDDDETPGRLASMTDPLDAWVLHARGMRSTPAQKPATRLDRTTRAFLDLVCDERPPGWVAAACSMLDVNPEAQKKLWKAIDKLRPRARERGLPQRCTLAFGETGPEPMLICATVVPNEQAERLDDALTQLVDQRLREHGPQRVLGIGVSVRSRRPYDALQVVERAWWEPSPDSRRSEDQDGLADSDEENGAIPV